MTFETLKIRKEKKRQRRNKLATVVGTTIALGSLFYFYSSMYQGRQIEKKLEPLKKQFEYVAENHKSSIERIQGFDEKKVLNYGGALDEIVAKRDSICKGNNAFYAGTWTAGDYGVSFNGLPICYKPF